MTLYERIIAEAPEGLSERSCPGAFFAIVAKQSPRVAVYFCGVNDAPRHADSIRQAARDFLAAE